MHVSELFVRRSCTVIRRIRSTARPGLVSFEDAKCRFFFWFLEQSFSLLCV